MTTEAGRGLVRLRGLFGGETLERATAWVETVEAEARAPLVEAIENFVDCHLCSEATGTLCDRHRRDLREVIRQKGENR